MRSAQMKMIIGSLMRELREWDGASLAHSAQRSGWSKGHLSRVERGITKPSLELVLWYDVEFGADYALIRQFVELEEAVRQDRMRTLAHARNGAAENGSTGGSVPADFDPRDRCVLISETVPDGTFIFAGHDFVKSWTVRNAGPVRWTCRWLTRQGGPGVPGWLRSPRRVAVPEAAPGEDVLITVPMRASEWTGAGIAYFEMTDEAGRPYFPDAGTDPFFCTVQVMRRPLNGPATHQDQ
jgi:transcriptional regulator with XRE-family HTH domain